MQHVTWSPPNPDGWDIDTIRPLRGDIDTRVQALIAALSERSEWERPAGLEPRHPAAMPQQPMLGVRAHYIDGRDVSWKVRRCN